MITINCSIDQNRLLSVINHIKIALVTILFSYITGFSPYLTKQLPSHESFFSSLLYNFVPIMQIPLPNHSCIDYLALHLLDVVLSFLLNCLY